MGKSQVNVMLTETQIAKLDRMCVEIPGVRPASTRPKLCSWLLGSAIDAAPEPDQPKPRKVARPGPPMNGRPVTITTVEGARLRAAREAAGLTQPELATALSSESVTVSRNQIHRAERAASLEQWPALRAWLDGQGAKP